jgi:probable rRNA maturation factor
MITVSVVKEVSCRVPQQLLRRCAVAVNQVMGEKKARTVAVVVVSEQKIKKLNTIYRKKNTVTDVLSFGDKDEAYLGDLFLCYKQLVRQAREKKHAVSKEFAILTIHGLFHLYGYDHETEREAAVMEPKEAKALKAVYHKSRRIS